MQETIGGAASGLASLDMDTGYLNRACNGTQTSLSSSRFISDGRKTPVRSGATTFLGVSSGKLAVTLCSTSGWQIQSYRRRSMHRRA